MTQLNELISYFTISIVNTGSKEIILIVIITLMFNKIRVFSDHIYYRAFTNLIGTLFHELAHFFVAVIFCKIPKSISIIPYSDGNMHNYGRIEVKYSDLNLLNTFPINIAPILIIPTIVLNQYFIDLYFKFASYSLVSNLIFLYLIIVLVTNAIPSRSDLVNGFGSASFLFWVTISVLFYYQQLITLDVIFEFFINGFTNLNERFL